MKVYISRPDFSERERAALRAFSEPGVTQFAQGPEVAKFEQEFAQFIGQDVGLAVNSGSSANLLLFDALIDMGKLRKGDEVLVPATTFATVVAPLYQLGLVPVYVDVEEEGLNIDPNKITEAISEKSKVIFVVHTLGRPAAMKEIGEIAESNGLILLEDCCEAHGAAVGDAKVGSFSMASTFSFFVAHNMTTGEGGMAITSNEELAEVIRSLREFGRAFGERWDFEDKYLEGYDRRYVFLRPGYNLRMLDIQAALGRVQLQRLPEMNGRRREIASIYGMEFFGKPELVTGHVYYGYGMMHKKRDAIVRQLDKCGIETRPIFCGAMHLQPGYRHLTHRVASSDVSERVLKMGFFLPCHSAMTDEQVEYVVDTVKVCLAL